MYSHYHFPDVLYDPKYTSTYTVVSLSYLSKCRLTRDNSQMTSVESESFANGFSFFRLVLFESLHSLWLKTSLCGRVKPITPIGWRSRFVEDPGYIWSSDLGRSSWSGGWRVWLWTDSPVVRICLVLDHFDFPPVIHDWVNKGLGMSSQIKKFPNSFCGPHKPFKLTNWPRERHYETGEFPATTLSHCRGRLLFRCRFHLALMKW